MSARNYREALADATSYVERAERAEQRFEPDYAREMWRSAYNALEEAVREMKIKAFQAARRVGDLK